MRKKEILILARLIAVLFVVMPAGATAEERFEPIEPLFTERAFLDHAAELGTEWAKESDGDEIEVAAGLEWTLWERLEIGAEIPMGINVPDHGSTEVDLSDIEFAAQALLCCDGGDILDFFSIRAAVEAPTGDRSKGIGGDGAWEISALPGRFFTVVPQLPDVLTQLQLSYTEQIRLDDEQRETASELGLSETREKAFIWNIAFAQAYFDEVFRPVFEVLGTTIVDALVDDDQSTIVELGWGFWVAPHPKEHWLSSLSYRIGYKLPVTSRKEDQSVLVFVLEWDLD